MTLAEIREFPTSIGTGHNGKSFHESVLRSYQIVAKVKELLADNTPSKVILELIEDLEHAPKTVKEAFSCPVPVEEKARELSISAQNPRR